jgi:hypothetical protein
MDDIKLGPTGKFPGGKLNAFDEGELKIAIMADTEKKIVGLHFGKNVSWIGFPHDVAIDFAKKILDAAEKILRHNSSGGSGFPKDSESGKS